MLRPLLLSLLLVAPLAPLALAAEVDIVDVCERYTICPIVRTQTAPLKVCAGLGLGLQGAVACAYENQYGAKCAFVAFGFERYDTCDLSIHVSLP